MSAAAYPNGWFGLLSDAERARLAGVARHYLRCRMRRSLGPADALFADPAWDLLLDLFAAKMEGSRITKSSAYIASGAPNATAHRFVAKLLEGGHVREEADNRDGRCILLGIDDLTASNVASWLDETFAGWTSPVLSPPSQPGSSAFARRRGT